MCQFVEDIDYDNWISIDAELDSLVASIEEQENEEENVNLISIPNQIFEYLDLSN